MSSPLTRLSAAAVAAIGTPGSLGRLRPTTASLTDTTIRFQSSKAAAPKGKPTKFSSKTSSTASSKKKKGSSSSTGQRDKSLDLVIRALDAPKMKEPISEEEKQRRYEIDGTTSSDDLNSTMPVNTIWLASW
ncbi:hypothetical protein MHU86_21722 [Fragilaria crotonensis]|nr:hypothetical protein MHU86_21722 [Fragilaria crotonensis]